MIYVKIMPVAFTLTLIVAQAQLSAGQLQIKAEADETIPLLSKIVTKVDGLTQDVNSLRKTVNHNADASNTAIKSLGAIVNQTPDIVNQNAKITDSHTLEIKHLKNTIDNQQQKINAMELKQLDLDGRLKLVEILNNIKK